MSPIRRAIVLVLDSVGVGEMADAERYGDGGCNTLGHIDEAVGGLRLPTLGSLGIGNIISLRATPPSPSPAGAFGKMAERSVGKDSITGHWELAGVVLDRAFPLYPRGFPQPVIADFEEAIGRPVLGNVAASGTEIIRELGEEHLRTARPIVYTSADSVFQVAAHLEAVPLDELYRWCRQARGILSGAHEVARVIARPFSGPPGAFARTKDRRDFSVAPPAPTILDIARSGGLSTTAIGKVFDLFSGRGIGRSLPEKDNEACLEALLGLLGENREPGIVFCTLVDFDMLFGHRNDPAGYAEALRRFDDRLIAVLEALGRDDALFVTADHGNDPTTPSTDHSREYVPILVTGEAVRESLDLGVRSSFADVAATIRDLLDLPGPRTGKSFAAELLGQPRLAQPAGCPRDP
ncbi:MAG: phosphopentomutase [Actinomycetota bacterium]